VHDWTLQALNRDIHPEYFWLAVLCVASNVKMSSERDYWQANQRLVQHAMRLEHRRFQDVLDTGNLNESQCDDLDSLGDLWSYQNRFLRSELMYQRALAGYEKALGPDHTSTLNTVNGLGNLYRDQGKMVEAEEMYQRALAGCEKALGPDHTSTLNTVNNLGILYRDQGRMAEAEEMSHRALTGYEKALGPDHTSTLSTVNNLGNLYRDQGKLVEAEEMYHRALAGKEKALGPDHTSTLNTVNSLGNLYSAQGQLAEYIQLADFLRNNSADLFGGLGRMLIKYSDESNSKIAFQQEIGYENGMMVYKNIRCDGCDLSITCDMRRFVCKDCSDVDLCGECLVKHETGVREVPTCSHYSFLDIALQTSSGSEQGSVTEETSRTSWLQDLIMKYPEKAA
jgi:tetratricopeptide (TPR) repeat protein